MTANRSQGQTLEKVILALSYHEATGFSPTYQAVYVEMSRVHKNNDIQLLLTGKTEHEK